MYISIIDSDQSQRSEDLSTAKSLFAGVIKIERGIKTLYWFLFDFFVRPPSAFIMNHYNMYSEHDDRVAFLTNIKHFP